jgi:pimeloyl-ACP methyl ester carboxylesterase
MSTATTSKEIWSPEKRSAVMKFRFDDGSFHEQRVVFQNLEPEKKDDRVFSLYYFVKDQTYDPDAKPENKPTILFVAGGPGQLILPDTENFVDMHGYRVVYFHVRGSGFSQIPDSRVYDKFLTTSYIVKDIEKIRADLHVAQWKAVIGHSYGAVVAHEYARNHGEHVEKVVLSAPIVPASLSRPEVSPKKKFATGIPAGQTFETLSRIYNRKDFGFLDNDSIVRFVADRDVRKYLVDAVRALAASVKGQQLSLTSVINNYSDLQQVLTGDLDYGAAFFGALRRLGHVGWLALDIPYARPLRTPKVDDTQVECGLVIAKAILLKKFKFSLESILNDQRLKDKLTDGENLLTQQSSLRTDRSYYLISYNDGLYGRFRENHIKKGILATDPSIPAFGPQPKEAEPWNNEGEDWTHGTPTLILKGSADPVTEQGEAEYYFNEALTGERVLVEFLGVGHSMALPDVRVSDPEYSKNPDLLKANVGIKGSKETKFLSTRDKLIDAFLHDTVKEFEGSDILASLKRAFEHCMRDQTKSEILVSGVNLRPLTVTSKASNLAAEKRPDYQSGRKARLKTEPVA